MRSSELIVSCDIWPRMNRILFYEDWFPLHTDFLGHRVDERRSRDHVYLSWRIAG